jgi:hypothetical protein
MPENKTKPTNASVEGYIASRANEQQQADCKQLMTLLKKITKERATMWGPSIVGYGRYHYTYDSGRSGDMPLASFAIRGNDIVLYLADYEKRDSLLAKLGKHKIGRSCLYFRQMSDLDKSVLEQLVVESVAEIKRRYG